MGMAVYQRLLLLEAELLSISRQHHAITPTALGDVPTLPLPSTSGFPGMARISGDGSTSVFLGELRLIPTVSPAQWALLRQKKTLLTTAADETGARRLFLVRLSDSDTSAVV